VDQTKVLQGEGAQIPTHGNENKKKDSNYTSKRKTKTEKGEKGYLIL